MFGCNNKQTVLHPNKEQKRINENQLKLMKDKCEGKEFCSALACDSWWNSSLKCPSHEPPIMWLRWRCNGIHGKHEGASVNLVGSCEGGEVKIIVSIWKNTLESS